MALALQHRCHGLRAAHTGLSPRTFQPPDLKNSVTLAPWLGAERTWIEPPIDSSTRRQDSTPMPPLLRPLREATGPRVSCTRMAGPMPGPVSANPMAARAAGAAGGAFERDAKARLAPAVQGMQRILVSASRAPGRACRADVARPAPPCALAKGHGQPGQARLESARAHAGITMTPEANRDELAPDRLAKRGPALDKLAHVQPLIRLVGHLDHDRNGGAGALFLR